MADQEDDPSDLFAIPDFWRSSSWLDQHLEGESPLFTFDLQNAACLDASQSLISPTRVPVRKIADDNEDVFFKLPSLLRELADQEVKQHTPNSKPPDQHVEAEREPETSLSADDEDLWLSPVEKTERPSKYQTWEGFEQEDQGPCPPLFVTEAGPAAFDALLASKEAHDNAAPDILDARIYCACLLSLALGRSSILFSWDPEQSSFVKTAPALRVPGLSLESIKAIDRLCLDCGNSARHLQTFADATYSAAASPTRVALAGVVDRLVTVVRSELNNRSRDARSILQLQSIVQPVSSVLCYFKGLVKKLSREESDEGVLSCLFQEAQASEYRDELLREVTREVLRILSKPWTDFVEEWIGLKAEEGVPVTKAGPGKCFVKVADKMWVDDQGHELDEADYFLDEDKLPTFIPEDMAQTIFETGRNLRFLREHQAEHPLSRLDVVTLAMPPKLEWKFDWAAVSKLEARVNEYRNAVSRAIQGLPPKSHRGEPISPGVKKRKFSAIELEYFGKLEAEVEATIIASMRYLDQPPENRVPQDELARLLQDRLYRTTTDMSLESDKLSPHWALAPLLSFGPVIEAQSSLVNQECMKLLFRSHHLRTHIDLLRQSFLLGNGLLCSRLSHALFDPNLNTAEHRAGVALGGGMMGLRLGGRQTWPPSSSELRLALMGILSECYEPPYPAPADQTAPSRGTKSDLPGDLSFAVRDLSQEEIDRCMDPDSLEALDFLRLSYKPPAPLRPVMAPTVLLKYDRIFKLLLRVLRMLYVANELFATTNSHTEESNASLRFRIEARHFIRQVASYFFDVGTTAPWRRFEAWLDRVEAESSAECEPVEPAAGARRNNSSNKKAYSPDALRERQEQVLDEIMSVLLLRKRQAPVLRLLEDTYGVVLRFAKGLSQRTRARGAEAGKREESPEELYRLFRKKVEVFVTVCRGLGEKMGTGTSSSGGEGGGGGNPVEQLLAMLDISGYYGKRTGV
ncbi:Spc98 family-domain-containing protein [Achaetomium macrosporum]|uniref:Spindle pole body component n=1 Tax=Achaetomium macrosporum TaxID=79813 RepID=A0AAN7H9M3_9PEZI|nr:Spc98 family-domain-containing protein [Achaetomium macrosporum]